MGVGLLQGEVGDALLLLLDVHHLLLLHQSPPDLPLGDDEQSVGLAALLLYHLVHGVHPLLQVDDQRHQLHLVEVGEEELADEE